MSALAWALLAACGGGEADTGASADTGARDTANADTAETSDTGETGVPPRDLDGDGVDDRTDCDDRDPDRTPGRAEDWDGVDNDCDARADADGRYAGTVPANAVAVYEGQTRRFTLWCPTTVERARRRLALTLSCATDPDDSWAQLLLGATLSLSAEDTYAAFGPTWVGTAALRSSNGWDSDADVRLAWTATPAPGDALDALTLEVTVSAPFLGLSASGDLALDAR